MALIFTPCIRGLLARDDADGLFEIYILAAGEFGLVVEPGAGYVEHTDDSGFGVGDDVLREASEGVAARASSVHDGGDARVNPGEVGIYARLVDAVIDVGVQVYESGRDELASDVYHAGLRAWSDVRGDLRDRAAGYGDVHLGVNRPCDGSRILPPFRMKIGHLGGLRECLAVVFHDHAG